MLVRIEVNQTKISRITREVFAALGADRISLTRVGCLVTSAAVRFPSWPNGQLTDGGLLTDTQTDILTDRRTDRQPQIDRQSTVSSGSRLTNGGTASPPGQYHRHRRPPLHRDILPRQWKARMVEVSIVRPESDSEKKDPYRQNTLNNALIYIQWLIPSKSMPLFISQTKSWASQNNTKLKV